MEAAAEEAKEAAESDKATKKDKWEATISRLFEPAPQQSAVNAKPDEELTPEEREARQKFRDSRENWKKQDGSSEVVVRIIFTKEERAKQWLSKVGLPPTFLLHEKELD